MYLKERARIYQIYLACYIIGLSGFALVIMSLAVWSGRTGFLYSAFYYYFPPFHWVWPWLWPWLPGIEAPLDSVLLSVPTLTGLIFIVTSGGYLRYTKYYLSLIREVERISAVEALATRRTGICGASRASCRMGRL